MTEKEKEVMQHLINFWNGYLALPDTTGVCDTEDIRHAIHKIQGVMAIRVARRVDPDIWR